MTGPYQKYTGSDKIEESREPWHENRTLIQMQKFPSNQAQQPFLVDVELLKVTHLKVQLFVQSVERFTLKTNETIELFLSKFRGEEIAAKTPCPNHGLN